MACTDPCAQVSACRRWCRPAHFCASQDSRVLHRPARMFNTSEVTSKLFHTALAGRLASLLGIGLGAGRGFTHGRSPRA